MSWGRALGTDGHAATGKSAKMARKLNPTVHGNKSDGTVQVRVKSTQIAHQFRLFFCNRRPRPPLFFFNSDALQAKLGKVSILSKDTDSFKYSWKEIGLGFATELLAGRTRQFKRVPQDQFWLTSGHHHWPSNHHFTLISKLYVETKSVNTVAMSGSFLHLSIVWILTMTVRPFERLGAERRPRFDFDLIREPQARRGEARHNNRLASESPSAASTFIHERARALERRPACSLTAAPFRLPPFLYVTVQNIQSPCPCHPLSFSLPQKPLSVS